jgi:hypothetical protein
LLLKFGVVGYSILMASRFYKIAFQVAAGVAVQVGTALPAQAVTPTAQRQMECAVRLSGLDLIERRIEAASAPGLFERTTRFDEARRYFNLQAVKRKTPEALMTEIEAYADGLRQKYRGQADGVEATHNEATAYANHCYIYHDETVVLPRSRFIPR